MIDKHDGTWFSWVWRLQALYFLVTGIWPCLEIRSFQKISGPKTDIWLVKTVGVLVSVIGGVLGVAGMRRRITPESAGLAVYLLDALVEVLFIVAWGVGLRRQRRGAQPGA